MTFRYRKKRRSAKQVDRPPSTAFHSLDQPPAGLRRSNRAQSAAKAAAQLNSARRGISLFFIFTLTVITSAIAAPRSDRPTWEQLNKEVISLYAAHKYTDALATADRAIDAARSEYGAISQALATALSNRAILYEATYQPAKATSDYKASLSVLHRLGRQNDPDVALVSDSLAGLYRNEGSFSPAEMLLREALNIRTARFGAKSLQVATTLAHLGLLFEEKGDYRNAESLQRQALRIREAAGKDVSVSLNDLASTLEQEGQYDEAAQKAEKSLTMRRSAAPPDFMDIAVTEDNLGVVYADEGRYSEAEALHQSSLEHRKEVLTENDPDLAYPLNNLALLYVEEGRYSDAERLYLQALDLRARSLGARSALVAATLDNLATLYATQDRFADAESLYQRAVNINESVYGKDTAPITDTLNNLAEMYEAEGQYAAAEDLLKRVLKIRTVRLGASDLATAGSLTNLAVLYEEQSRYKEAEPLARRAVAIYERRLPPNHPLTAKALNNLAIIYQDEKNNSKAEQGFLRSLASTESISGPNHPDVGITLNNIALLYKTETRYSEAITAYQRSLEIAESTQAMDGSAVGTTLSNLAMTYYAADRPAEALNYFERALENRHAQFRNQFSHMNERERLNFLNETSGLMPVFISFASQYQEQFPQLTHEVFDLLLWIKGLVVGSMANERAFLVKQRDPAAVALYDQLTAARRASAALANLNRANYKGVDARRAELVQQADDIEKRLAERSAQFASSKRAADYAWNDIRQALSAGEAAVEYVTFDFHDGRKWTGDSKYAALVVTNSSLHPEMILLPDTSGDRGEHVLDDYKKWIVSSGALLDQSPGRAFARRFWDPILPHLGGATRVYVAPDGALNVVAFGILPATNGHLLMEDFDLRLLVSTRDLLRGNEAPLESTAALFGDPRFSLTEDRKFKDYGARGVSAPVSAIKAVTEPSLTLRRSATLRDGASRCRDTFGRSALCPLPQTAAEVVNLAESLNSHNWRVSGPFLRELASKETVLAVEHPRLLHIATHGFWSELAATSNQAHRRVTLAQDSMLRSGLYLAGADETLRRTGRLSGSTGVLTAYEVATMDLRGTELVVLSACDTGLGDVQNGEGVFGLRRGLQEAGAEATLMAMWAVPERESKEIMTAFYAKWLNGDDKHEALREAELAERDQVIRRWGFDRKDLWGAFVIVGK
jgi:tetratricopeptide (TPR) repeat protein/CHAT domain-containing protein